MQKERLESLDVLRGLDLFILVGFQSVFMYLARATGENSWLKAVFDTLFTHVEWEGFHLWDQVMPLFLFMAGTSIPYAMAKYKRKEERNGNQNNQNRWRSGAEKDQQTGKGNYTKDRNTGRRYAGYHV